MGAKYEDAYGKTGREYRKNPYAPSLSSIPASITEPDVGASTCASGNHRCKGIMGTLTAKEKKNASQRISCRDLLISLR
jgi:hypothetical protein